MHSTVARQWSSNPVNTCRAFSGKASSASTSAMSSSSLPTPFGTVRPNSVARPRMAFASIVCCLTNRHRAECSARIPCCSKRLAGTNFTAGRDAASQIAAASAASFFLPFFTNGLIASGAISFTSCPSSVSMRAQGCAAPQASITTVQASCLSKNGIRSLLCSLRFISTFPASSTAWTWKTVLAVSKPIMQMLVAGGSLSVGSHDPHFGTLMPLGAVHPISEVAAEADIALIVQVKDNQPTLHQQNQAASATTDPLGSAHSHDRGRNRDERRTVSVFDPVDKLAATSWHSHVATIIRVERDVFTRNARTGLLVHSSDTAFYVSNTPVTAARPAYAIRAHWV